MEQDEIIRTVTPGVTSSKKCPTATRMIHNPRKQRERQVG